jgi:hypothetical protein
MKEIDSVALARLEKILNSEIAVYEQYGLLLQKEQELIVSYKTDQIPNVTRQREALLKEASNLEKERLLFLREIFGDVVERSRLMTLIEENCSSQQIQRLRPKVFDLSSAARSAQTRSEEFNRVTRFSLDVVNGALSIIRSATQNVVKSYNTKGSLRESFNPVRSRIDNALTKA